MENRIIYVLTETHWVSDTAESIWIISCSFDRRVLEKQMDKLVRAGRFFDGHKSYEISVEDFLEK